MRLIIASFLVVLLYSCAQLGSLTGGPKDETPPKVLESQPANKTLNFNFKTAIIQFDEYIQLQSLKKELIISPALNPEPEIKVKNKNLIINFNDCLLAENTTYVLNFGNAIVDYNERNKLENFNYVFSTGSYIDSLHINGTVISSVLNKPANGNYVMLYKNLADSAVYKTKPYYFAKTNEAGEYRLKNLKAGTYQIIALQDENSNFKFDQKNEAIGFLEKSIVLSENIDSLQLQTFVEEDTLQYVKRVKHSKKGKIDIVMYQKTDSISISSTSPFWDYLEVNKTNDSLTIWYTSYNDSAVIILNDFSFDLRDTLNIPSTPQFTKREKNRKKNLTYKTNLSEGKIDYKQPFQFTFNSPITYIKDKIHLFLNDSTELSYTVHTQHYNKQLQIKHEYEANKSYYIVIDSAAFLGIDSAINIKPDTLRFTHKTIEDYGKLILKIDSLKPETSYILQLTTGTEQIVKQLALNSDTILIFDFLKPTVYKFKLIEDTNKNGKWDTGNFLKKQYPEKIIPYSEPQTIRANWDLEIDWIVNP